MTHALITGASAGIGEAFARLLAQRGYSVIIVARREERLRELASEIEHAFDVSVTPLTADLADPQAPATLARELDERGIRPELLVNNAGFSISEGFLDADWSVHAREIQVMVTAVTELCHRLAPAMRDQGRGYIINVASLAALVPTPPGLLYTGIKSYVLHASQAMDMELKPRGVHVTALCPGFTWSEFHDVMGNRDRMNRLPGLLWSTADEVAEAGYRGVRAGQPVVMPGRVNQVMTAVSRILPERLRYAIGRRVDF
jgi:short-subunit dehydrogenase